VLSLCRGAQVLVHEQGDAVQCLVGFVEGATGEGLEDVLLPVPWLWAGRVCLAAGVWRVHDRPSRVKAGNGWILGGALLPDHGVLACGVFGKLKC
jgi:hypothetical protein